MSSALRHGGCQIDFSIPGWIEIGPGNQLQRGAWGYFRRGGGDYGDIKTSFRHKPHIVACDAEGGWV